MFSSKLEMTTFISHFETSSHLANELRISRYGAFKTKREISSAIWANKRSMKKVAIVI